MESVRDKVVLVTGASSGIGAAVAVLFAKYGSRLILTARNEENLNKTAEQCILQGIKRNQVLTVVAHQEVDDDVKRLVDMAVSTFGTIDILVNCAAGIFPASLVDTSMENFDAAYRLNLRAVVFLTKLVVPYLKKSKGTIVNISSTASRRGDSAIGPYCVMKAGLSMVTKDLALELAPSGVRVNEICPAHTRTPLLEGIFASGDKPVDEALDELGSIYPLQRIGRPEEVAQAIVFLASEASSFTTGESLKVDGGILQTASWDALMKAK